MILQKILETKKNEVELSKSTLPLSELVNMAGFLPAPRNFTEAIINKNCSIIAEIKRNSPSSGTLRNDFDHLQIASVYQKNGAAAISVLTDKAYFGGDIGFLSEIKKVVKLPLLRKDFIIDSYQIFETYAFEGDAVLFIANILSYSQLKDFIDIATFLGLSSLVEVHTESDLEKAEAAGATLIGINNRNLNTFKTDISSSINLAPIVSPGKIIISESGINSRQDIYDLLKVGIKAYLIGEALMRSEDIGKKLRFLLGEEQ